MMKSWATNGAAFLVIFLIVAGAAAFGGLFGVGDWYKTIQKPAWNPPNWIFGPVWSLLYLSMAVAAWLVWMRRGQHAVTLPLALFAAQLLLNALWTPLFFGAHWMGVALADILAMDLLILACIFAFWPVHRVAGALMVPYAAWVSFATVLNFTLWRLNS